MEEIIKGCLSDLGIKSCEKGVISLLSDHSKGLLKRIICESYEFSKNNGHPQIMIDDVKLSTKLSKELHAKNDHGKPEDVRRIEIALNSSPLFVSEERGGLSHPSTTRASSENENHVTLLNHSYRPNMRGRIDKKRRIGSSHDIRGSLNGNRADNNEDEVVGETGGVKSFDLPKGKKKRKREEVDFDENSEEE